MKQRPRVSVVMPTFNVEPFFRECLESVVNQELQEIEIIPVDDGSPDQCGAIMDEYAARDPRVRPIHQDNGGYGKAVNAGISAAQGDYIGIVETDDRIAPTMHARLLSAAESADADIAKCDYYLFGEEQRTVRRDFIKQYKLPVGVPFRPTEYPAVFCVPPSIWGAIYRRSFIEEHGLRVPETQGASFQDVAFAFETLALARCMVFVDEPLLYYRQDNPNASVKSLGKLDAPFEMCARIDEFLASHPTLSVDRDALFRVKFNVLSFNLHRVAPQHKPKFFYRMQRTLRSFSEEADRRIYFFTDYERRLLDSVTRGSYIRFWLDFLGGRDKLRYLLDDPPLREEIGRLRNTWIGQVMEPLWLMPSIALHAGRFGTRLGKTALKSFRRRIKRT